MSEPAAGLTGGCQCGAVRYRLAAAPFDSNLCHCRMCQKASGGPFMVFASVKRDAFEVTRGEIARYKSSQIAERGFCAHCGTPLTYEGNGAKHVSVTLGSLDDPNAVGPKEQLGQESEVQWLRAALQAPSSRTDEWLAKKHLKDAGSHQHPDHET